MWGAQPFRLLLPAFQLAAFYTFNYFNTTCPNEDFKSNILFILYKRIWMHNIQTITKVHTKLQ